MSDVAKPNNPADDWKFWLVVNPATWLMPIFFAALAVAIVIHWVVYKVGLAYV